MDSTSIASGNSLTNNLSLFLEYLITKYGNGKGVAPDSGHLDNLYCKSAILLLVTLMPTFSSHPLCRGLFHAYHNAGIHIRPCAKEIPILH